MMFLSYLIFIQVKQIYFILYNLYQKIGDLVSQIKVYLLQFFSIFFILKFLVSRFYKTI